MINEQNDCEYLLKANIHAYLFSAKCIEKIPRSQY